MNDHFWLVCHTKPRCEKKFAALMAAEKFEHYLALVVSVRHYAQQTKKFTKPLFPGYVFAQVPVEEKSRIYQQELLARAITVTDEPRFLRQLADVKMIVASGFELSRQFPRQQRRARGGGWRVGRDVFRGEVARFVGAEELKHAGPVGRLSVVIAKGIENVSHDISKQARCRG